jgi:hypothetical protein
MEKSDGHWQSGRLASRGKFFWQISNSENQEQAGGIFANVTVALTFATRRV